MPGLVFDEFRWKGASAVDGQNISGRSYRVETGGTFLLQICDLIYENLPYNAKIEF